MKQVYLFLMFLLMASKSFATGEPSTYFNIYLPPNNDPTHRYVALVVTAIYDSTSFSIVDDDMDGDADDSHSGVLMAGQSYVLFIKDNGVNDDADWSAGGEQKADGDYFIITSDKLIYASQATKSDWQHDWMPATNKSSRGERFILYTPGTSNSNRDVNVFAYENETTITVRKISASGTLNTGYTNVDINTRDIVLQRTVDVGQDLINYFPDGQNILESGHTYIVESNKPVTVQYGALYENARDGGGYVPSSTGGSSGDLFYFSVPYQADTEQEIRVISLDDANEVMLERYSNGSWLPLKTWTLDQRKAAEWVGKREGNVTYPTVFRVTCSTGKQVMVLEANWMETGSPGTSDMATMATSMLGKSAGKDFLVYMAPPGYQNNATDPLTGEKLSAGTHAYLFAFNKDVNVTVKDANTNGQVINRTYFIEAGRYADCNLDLAQWRSIYNGDGNPDSGSERPYLTIEADENISVLVTNFNDNWMNYFGSSLEQSFKQTSTSTSSTGVPGDTIQVETVISNESTSSIEEATVSVIIPNGLSPVNTTIKNLTTGEESTGSFTTDETTGQSTGTFDEVTSLDPNTNYEVTSDAVIGIKYNDGTVIDESAVFAVETITSGSVDGVFQESTSASGVSVTSSDNSNLVFSKDNSGVWSSKFTDSWTANWVDYDGDNDLDLFVPSYSKQQPNLVYRNIGSGQFQEVTATGLANKGASAVASSWADYDNDGDLDVVIANNLGTASALWLNNGSGSFEKANTNLNDTDGYDHGASWTDIDNDGQLDLFVLDFLTVNFNRAYLNDGELSLDVGSKLAGENKRSIGASWADYDNDGFQDVFVPNGSPDGFGDNNSLFRNLGNGDFEQVAEGEIVSEISNSVASTWGDYNNDGFIDLFVANASNQPNQLYKNNSDGTFTKQDIAPFNSHKGNSHGCSWLDYDNDGDLDLLVLNNGSQGNFLYRNNGDGTFTSIDYELITTSLTNAMGLSIADMDKDGDLDVFVATFGGAQNHLFTNNGNSNNWVAVKLIGTESNRSAIGATISVKATIGGVSVWQMRQVSSQNGLGGQNSLNQHFGLRKAESIDSIMVKWPSGTEQYLTNQSVNQEIVIIEAQTATINGLVFIDENANCVYDNGETVVPNVKIKLDENVTVYSDSTGQYRMVVEPGNYSVSLATSANWQATCESSYNVGAMAINVTYGGYDFAVTGKYEAKDLKVTLGTTALRRGFHNDLILTCENNGTALAIGETLTLQLSDEVIAVSASIPWDAKEGNTYYWTIDSIKIGEQKVIAISDSVSLESELGSVVQMSVQVSDESDNNILDNTFLLQEEIVGAVDPNDLQASPIGWGVDHLITSDDRVQYKIRFQNVGNYFAQHVSVTDQLPMSVGMESFVMESASHAYQMEIDGRNVSWFFNNINLPDSARDEKGSHGYIIFSVKPQSHIISGTEMLNEAEIVFDYEKPLVTNSVWHKVLNGSFSKSDYLKVYPNPITEKALVSIIPTDRQVVETSIKRLEVYDTKGLLVKIINEIGDRVELNREGLKSGLYLLKAVNASGLPFTTRVKIE